MLKIYNSKGKEIQEKITLLKKEGVEVKDNLVLNFEEKIFQF